VFSLWPVIPKYVPMFRANMSAFLSLRTNTERISMKFGKVITTTNKRNDYILGENGGKGTRHDRKFESTSNECCHVANDFTVHTVHTTRCPQGWRVHYTHAVASGGGIM